MTHRLRARQVVIAVICISWLGVAPLIAAPAAAISALNVDIWPEHDDPRVLVIYRGTLGADVPLPYTLELSVPAAAQVHATAYRRDGELFTARYQTAASGDQARITFSVPVRDFQFEYYVDLLSGPPLRTFVVDLVFPLPVANLQVSVEQPLRASGFTLTPATTRTAASGGFTYYLYAEQQWPAGKAWSVRGSYRKEDSAPSVSPAPQPLTPARPSAEQGFSLSWLLPMVAGVILGVAGALIVTYVRRMATSRRRPTAATPRRRNRGARHDTGGERRYCANCGRRAGPRDRFCSNCGRPLPEG